MHFDFLGIVAALARAVHKEHERVSGVRLRRVVAREEEPEIDGFRFRFVDFILAMTRVADFRGQFRLHENLQTRRRFRVVVLNRVRVRGDRKPKEQNGSQ